MKYTHYFIFAIVLLLGFAAMAAVATDKAKTPSQSYLDYRAALEKATTLDEVLPFLSMAYCGMLEARPKEDHPVWLQRLKEAEEGCEDHPGEHPRRHMHGDHLGHQRQGERH
jgi:hypothetical protein